MATNSTGMRHGQLALALGMALGLVACGGGGGHKNVKPEPTPPPATPSEQPPDDAQLAITHTYEAHDAGFTGAGVTIGVVDSGIMRNHPTLAGRVTAELIYVDPGVNNTAIDDVVGHGTWVSEIAAGKPFGTFAGGIAPGADLVSARIISDKEPTDDGSGQGNPVTAADAAFFAQTLNPDLINAGVDVMNNSWGGIYWDTGNASINRAFGDAYTPFVVQHGGLVVFAAGNDSRADPSDIAALPSVAPQLEKGWLAVVAVDSNHPTQLADYSNACGKAMTYCLAAPGDVIVSGKDDTAGNASYWVVRGTSLAAPQVTGAAALVWQAFPYFDNDLVRQTLLGTADDLGAPGPDKIFGYGELDVGQAVKGPAKFDWGDVTVDFDGESTWSNAISGSGGLIKQGGGTLTLAEAASYSGQTRVEGGTLQALSLAGDASIGAQGTLANTAVSGDVANAGVVSISGADYAVGGDYTQQSGGRLAVSLGSRLQVHGEAAIAGSLYVFGANDGYTPNAFTYVLSSTGGLSGRFASLDTASNVLLTATLNYDNFNAWLDVQQVDVTAVQGLAYTAASFGAAQRVQAAFDEINTRLGPTLPAGLQPVAANFVQGAGKLQHAPGVGAVQSSLTSLSGQLHGASAAMMFEAIDAGTRALSQRFDQLLAQPRAGGWAQNLGYHGDMARAGFNSVGYDLSGWMVGADQRIGSNGFAGYALSQSRGLGRLAESADQGRSHAVEGMLYGGVVRGAWYGMGRFGVGSYGENMRRHLQLGTAFAGVDSSSRGNYGVAYGESGYRLGLGRTQLTPYASLEYAQLRRDGFDEQGAYGFGLKSSGQNTARWQAGLGLRATRKWMLADGGSLSLQTRMAWQQSFGRRGDVFEASFSGINQYAPLDGIGLSRYGGVVGTSLAWGINQRASLQLGYDQYLGQRQQAKMATANFSWAF